MSKSITIASVKGGIEDFVNLDKARGRLAVVYRPIDQLKLNPRNPRTHGRKQIRQIAESMRTFGFIVPVVVDSELNVIAGHGRVMAGRLLGWAEVPTTQLGHLSEAQIKAYTIADNRLTDNSTWDNGSSHSNSKSSRNRNSTSGSKSQALTWAISMCT